MPMDREVFEFYVRLDRDRLAPSNAALVHEAAHVCSGTRALRSRPSRRDACSVWSRCRPEPRPARYWQL